MNINKNLIVIDVYRHCTTVVIQILILYDVLQIRCTNLLVLTYLLTYLLTCSTTIVLNTVSTVQYSSVVLS